MMDDGWRDVFEMKTSSSREVRQPAQKGDKSTGIRRSAHA